MRYVGEISGPVRPIFKKYRIAATTAVGVPLLGAAANGAGLAQPTTTSLANVVGLSNDAGTYSTVKGSASPGVAVIVNPFGIYEARLSGGATSGTQLGIWTNSSANSAATTVTITTGDAAPNSPTMDEGFVACIAGANVGQVRKITSVTATTAVVTDPFDNTIAVGDVFIYGPNFPGDVLSSALVQLTADFTEFDASAAFALTAAARTIEHAIDFASVSQARRTTVARFLFDDPVFGRTT